MYWSRYDVTVRCVYWGGRLVFVQSSFKMYESIKRLVPVFVWIASYKQ